MPDGADDSDADDPSPPGEFKLTAETLTLCRLIAMKHLRSEADAEGAVQDLLIKRLFVFVT